MKTRVTFAALAPFCLLVGCGEPPPPATPPAPEPPPSASAPAPMPTVVEAPPVVTAAPVAAPLPPVDIQPATVPAAPEKMPTVKILAPKAGESIKADKVADFQAKIEVKDWPVATGGPHVHFILDNQPYKPIFEPTASLKLSEIAPSAKLDEGQHLLVAFPSRATHVSVKPEKGKSPLVVAPFWIGKAGKGGWKKTDPTLIYSRPKGTYNGPQADAVLLDFYLDNVDLGDKKDSIRATVTPPTGDAKTITITQWIPYTITNLPNGDTKVKLELLDKDGKAVPGAWNTTERTITVNHDAPVK